MLLRRAQIIRWVRPSKITEYLEAGWSPADQQLVQTEVINLRPAKRVIQAAKIEDDNAIIEENTNGNIDGQ